MSPIGPIEYRGRPVELGAEKQYDLRKVVKEGDPKGGQGPALFQHTRPVDWKPDLLAQLPGAQQRAAALGKAVDQLVWTDLATDREKAEYILAHEAKYGECPALVVDPNPDYRGTGYDANDWIKINSGKFGSVDEARVFLERYGWGHIHTSFALGAPFAIASCTCASVLAACASLLTGPIVVAGSAGSPRLRRVVQHRP